MLSIYNLLILWYSYTYLPTYLPNIILFFHHFDPTFEQRPLTRKRKAIKHYKFTTPYFIVHTMIQVYTYTFFEHTFGKIYWTEFNNKYFETIKTSLNSKLLKHKLNVLKRIFRV